MTAAATEELRKSRLAQTFIDMVTKVAKGCSASSTNTYRWERGRSQERREARRSARTTGIHMVFHAVEEFRLDSFLLVKGSKILCAPPYRKSELTCIAFSYSSMQIWPDFWSEPYYFDFQNLCTVAFAIFLNEREDFFCPSLYEKKIDASESKDMHFFFCSKRKTNYTPISGHILEFHLLFLLAFFSSVVHDFILAIDSNYLYPVLSGR